MRTTTSTNTTSMLKLLRAVIPDRPVEQAEHRRIAELQANKLRRFVRSTDAMLDSEAITQLPHVDVRFERALPTSGMSFWDGNSWVILLNPSEPETRQRFSLLHELHHIICHSKRGLLFGPKRHATTQRPNRWPTTSQPAH